MIERMGILLGPGWRVRFVRVVLPRRVFVLGGVSPGGKGGGGGWEGRQTHGYNY